MEIKLKNKYLDEFINVNGINVDKISFISETNETGEYIIIDLNDEGFDDTDKNIEVIDSDTVEEVLYALEKQENQKELDKKMFDTTGVVELSNGKVLYMDQKSRLDIISVLLLAIINPEENKVIEWKTPNGMITITVPELGEALMKSMQTRKELVIGV